MRTIAYITDLHLDEDFPFQHGVHTEENWRLILEDVRKRKIKEIIVGGDIGEVAAYSRFFKSISDLNLRVTPGNHDKPVELLRYSKLQHSATTAIYSSEEDDYLKYIFLDSSKEEIDQQQFEFLLAQLASPKAVLLFIHHPVLAVHTPVDTLHPLYGREKIFAALEKHKKDIFIFCGHYHMSDQRSIGSITQFVTPAASFQIVKEATSLEIDNSYFGYRIISIDKQHVTSRIVIYKDGEFSNLDREAPRPSQK